MNGPRSARLIALATLALLLFSPPLVGLFDRLAADRLSWLPLYLFLAWAGVIGLAAWLLEPLNKGAASDGKRDQEAPPDEK